jgi:3-phosphoshikimate 1-carboxyvinyltransferase
MLTATVPASKSITQRALVAASLASGCSVVHNPAECDDPTQLAQALRVLGVPIRHQGGTLEVTGGGCLSAPSRAVSVGNTGTAARLLAGLSLHVNGPLVLDGDQAMRRRPMTGLIDALRHLGVAVEELGRRGCPPLRFTRSSPPSWGVNLDPTGSSQQVSALLLAGTKLKRGLTINLEADVPSRPYVDMTLDVIREFGGEAGWVDDHALRVEPGLWPTELLVEADWSAAAMLLTGAWIAGKHLEIEGLSEGSHQPDKVVVEVLDRLSEGQNTTIDLGASPDVVPPVVAAALFARGSTKLTGIGHLRSKECDRISVLTGELRKLGAWIDESQASMTIYPAPLEASYTSLDPHGDHRMAMAFGLVGLRVDGLQVSDPECVSKSFPDFWQQLEVLR